MSDQMMSILWSDANGFDRLLTIRTLAGASGIVTALQGVSNGDWNLQAEGTISNQAPTTVNSTYNSVLDSARLAFQTASGKIITLRVPAPLLSIFMADTITVDPTQVAALTAACVGSLSDGSGNAATSYLGGFYERTGRAVKGGS